MTRGIIRIISGGQTGADQGALRAARAAGIATGGWAPRGWLTEDGPRRELLESYGLVECEVEGYRARTAANVRDSDGTLVFGYTTRGSIATMDECRIQGRPFFIVYERITRPSEVRAWIAERSIGVLNVAGPRESKAPGVGARVEAFLGRVLRRSSRP